MKKKYYEIIAYVDDEQFYTTVTTSLSNAVGVVSSLIFNDCINSVLINKEINYECD